MTSLLILVAINVFAWIAIALVAALQPPAGDSSETKESIRHA